MSSALSTPPHDRVARLGRAAGVKPALCAPAQVDASDAGSPPAGYVRFPWHIAASLALAYLFGYFGWHWSFVAAVFWLASNVEASRQRGVWAELKEVASAAAARDWERVLSHHRDRQQPSRGEPVHWLNRAIKECWPYYIAGISEYTRNVLLEPALTKYLPKSISNSKVFSIWIKHFSLGDALPQATGRALLASPPSHVASPRQAC